MRGTRTAELLPRVVEPFLHERRCKEKNDVYEGETEMAMRPMTTHRGMMSRADLFVVSSLFIVAMLLVMIAQMLGLHLL